MIYLDNAATTKPDLECLDRAKDYLYEKFYNPSALYAGGYNLHREITKWRAEMLDLVANSRDYQIIFTSCGSEADNQALFGGGKRGNVVSTLGEHSAVFATLNEIKMRGIEVRLAPLNADGSVNAEELLKLIDDKTSLVSVIHVNNETGAINDVNALAKEVKRKNARAIFHSDGVQAFGKIPFRICKEIDMYSISAHKIGGLKGTGALIMRKGLQIKPHIYGGGQEMGLRSGTENVFGISVFHQCALKKYANLVENYNKVTEYNKFFRQKIDSDLFDVISSSDGSPHILSLIAKGVRGEIILHEVDDKGLIIGTGSACSSNEKKRYSRVILSCGVSEANADGVLRISFSPENTLDEVTNAVQILNETVRRRREIME